MDETKPPGFSFMWLSVEKKTKRNRRGSRGGFCHRRHCTHSRCQCCCCCFCCCHCTSPCPHLTLLPTFIHTHSPLFTLTRPHSCSPLLPAFVRTRTHLPLFVLAAPHPACLFTLILAPSFVLGVAPTVPLIMLIRTLVHAHHSPPILLVHTRAGPLGCSWCHTHCASDCTCSRVHLCQPTRSLFFGLRSHSFVPTRLFDLCSGSFVLVRALLSFGGALCVLSSSCLCLYQIQS